ncbi:MAG: hypothetical protein JW724_07100 [Candidatus Altiarchaeota archaeon]|nr:hypothetical protein [Candidatus Altiarchaeota archaeon]
METVTLDVVNRNLKHILKELEEIREHMVDVDCILTEDDRAALAEARKEFKAKKAITLDEFERSLGL